MPQGIALGQKGEGYHFLVLLKFRKAASLPRASIPNKDAGEVKPPAGPSEAGSS